MVYLINMGEVGIQNDDYHRETNNLREYRTIELI